jgi:hypothetical protein
MERYKKKGGGNKQCPKDKDTLIGENAKYLIEDNLEKPFIVHPFLLWKGVRKDEGFRYT